MKRLAERVLLGGVVSGLGLFATASCSSTSGPPAGSGNSTGTAGSSNQSHGGTTGVGTGGSGTGIGGNGLPQGGTGTVGTAGTGTVGTAGSSAAAGSAGVVGTAGTGGAAAECSTDPNLVKSTGCYVGCDPALTTDNPQGIQGAFYVYGDGTAAAPKSCNALANPPCTTAGVCLSGTTKADKDYATGWGCGIGLELNNTGVKTAYTGPATCFNYTLTGSSGGNEVRISFTQSADTSGKVSPYLSLKPFTNGATGTICLKDVSCPTPAPVPPNCTNPTPSTPYDLQIQVVGGNNAGQYNLCLTSLTPVTNGTSTLAQLCGAQGSANGSEPVGKYIAQNNVFPGGQPQNTLCMTPALNGAAASFKVDSAVFQTGAVLNAYPSILDGWHYGMMSSDTALPKAISALTSANSAVTFSGSNNKYDAAYDIWVLPTLPSSAVKTPAGGLEIMIWLNHSNPPQPAGSQGGSFNGYNVWTGTVESWNYVAYEATGKTSFNGDLKPFITDAISRKGTQTTAAAGGPWLAGIEFGFEFYDAPSPGAFSVTSFTSDVK